MIKNKENIQQNQLCQTISSKLLGTKRVRWRRGVAVERRTRDQEVAGSSLGRASWCKNSGKVSHA